MSGRNALCGKTTAFGHRERIFRSLEALCSFYLSTEEFSASHRVFRPLGFLAQMKIYPFPGADRKSIFNAGGEREILQLSRSEEGKQRAGGFESSRKATQISLMQTSWNERGNR